MPVDFCNHLLHPHTQGFVRLNQKEKKQARKSLWLLPLGIFPAIIAYWAVTYVLKAKKLKNNTSTPTKQEDQTTKIFQKTKGATNTNIPFSSTGTKISKSGTNPSKPPAVNLGSKMSPSKQASGKLGTDINPSNLSTGNGTNLNASHLASGSPGTNLNPTKTSLGNAGINLNASQTASSNIAIPTDIPPSTTSSPIPSPQKVDSIPSAYTLDYSEMHFSNADEARKAVLTEGKLKSSPGRDVSPPDFTLRRCLRHASSQFPETLNPKALKEQKKHNENRFHIWQMTKIGLVFALDQDIDLPDQGIRKFEGALGEETLAMIAASFCSFYDSIKQQLPKHASWLSQKQYDWIQEQLKQMISGPMIDDNEILALQQILSDENYKALFAAASGFAGHLTINGIIENVAFIANRGYGCNPSGVAFFELPLRKELMTEQVATNIARPGMQTKGTFFDANAMKSLLGGKFLASHELDPQESGNCAYKSVEAFLFTLLAIEYLRSLDEEHFYENLHNKDMLEGACNAVRPLFEQWVNFDRRMTYDDLLEDFERTRALDDSNLEKMMYKLTLDYVENSKAYMEMLTFEDNNKGK